MVAPRMRRPSPYALAALLCGAAACHGPIAKVQWSYVDVARTVDNLVVYESIQHEARVGILFRGFETHIQERLEACRVHTTVRHGQPDADTADPDVAEARAGTEAGGNIADHSNAVAGTDASSTGANAAAGSHAAAGTESGANPAAEQARLTVVPWGGTYTRVSSRAGADITTKVDGSFKVELYDDRVKKVVWRAVVDVKTSSTPELSDGRDFADTVLARLRSDNVIRCPD